MTEYETTHLISHGATLFSIVSVRYLDLGRPFSIGLLVEKYRTRPIIKVACAYDCGMGVARPISGSAGSASVESAVMMRKGSVR